MSKFVINTARVFDIKQDSTVKAVLEVSSLTGSKIVSIVESSTVNYLQNSDTEVLKDVPNCFGDVALICSSLGYGMMVDGNTLVIANEEGETVFRISSVTVDNNRVTLVTAFGEMTEKNTSVIVKLNSLGYEVQVAYPVRGPEETSEIEEVRESPEEVDEVENFNPLEELASELSVEDISLED